MYSEASAAVDSNTARKNVAAAFMRRSYREWIGVLSVLDTKKCVNLDRDFESAIGPKRTCRKTQSMSLSGQSGHRFLRCTCLLLGQSTSKLSKQSIHALEIPRVKAFRKVAISGTKDFERFGAHALIHPEPRQVGCRAKFKRSRLLAACRSQSLFEKSFDLGGRRAPHKQRACL